MSFLKWNFNNAKVLLLLFFAVVVFGSSPSVGGVELGPKGFGLQVNVSNDLVGGPSSCNVFDVDANQSLNVTCAPNKTFPSIVNISLFDSEKKEKPFDPTHTYAIEILNSKFAGSKDVVRVLQGVYTPPLSEQRSTKPSESSNKPEKTHQKSTCVASELMDLFSGKLTSPDNAASADITFTGQATHSAGGSFQGNYNLMANLSGRCETGKTVSRLGPSLNLQGGNDPGGTPDSLNFGFLWDYPIHRFKSKGIQSINLINTGALESTQDFLQRDLIYSLDLKAVLQTKKDRKVQTYLYPDMGSETGKNLRGVLPQIDGRSIARLKIGATDYIIFNTNLPWLQDITLQTNWTRRWIMIPEITYKTNKTGPQFSKVAISTGARDYVNPALTFDLTKWLGITASYEYGSLPPKYQFLESKFTFGVSVKAAFKSSE